MKRFTNLFTRNWGLKLLALALALAVYFSIKEELRPGSRTRDDRTTHFKKGQYHDGTGLQTDRR